MVWEEGSRKRSYAVELFFKRVIKCRISEHESFFFNKNKYIQYINSCIYVRLNSYQDNIYSDNNELNL